MNEVFLFNPVSGPDTGQRTEFFLASVSSVSAAGVTIIPDGQTEATQKSYKVLVTGINLSSGDRVVVMRQSGTCVILGRIASGGSGGETAPANTVLAGPVSGDPAESSFRSLAAADIPALSTDILTSGTLPIARGGTGQDGLDEITTASEIVTAGTGWAIDSASFARWGHIAMVRIDMHTTQAMTTTTDTVLAVVATGKRPKFAAPCQVWLSGSQVAVIKPNGNVCSTASSLSSGVSYTLLSVYLLA